MLVPCVRLMPLTYGSWKTEVRFTMRYLVLLRALSMLVSELTSSV